MALRTAFDSLDVTQRIVEFLPFDEVCGQQALYVGRFAGRRYFGRRCQRPRVERSRVVSGARSASWSIKALLSCDSPEECFRRDSHVRHFCKKRGTPTVEPPCSCSCLTGHTITTVGVATAWAADFSSSSNKLYHATRSSLKTRMLFVESCRGLNMHLEL